MTENEALEMIKSMTIHPNCEMLKAFDFQSTVIKALEDLEQYRAIGTIEELKALKKEVELYRNLDKTNFSDGYNKAIDEFAEQIKELFKYESAWYKTMYHQRLVIDIGKIDEIAEQLKAGDNNE